MAHVIIVLNRKGGVGKTTTSINLSYALAEAGKRTLLIDLDPQGSSSICWDARENSDSRSAYHILTTDPNYKLGIEQCICNTSHQNLKIIPSSSWLSAIEGQYFTLNRRDNKLKAAIAPIQSQFDYIIIDNPPGDSILMVNSLTAASYILIPLPPAALAIEAYQTFHNQNLSALEELNPEILANQDIGIFINMFDLSKGNGPKETVKVIQEKLPKEFLLKTTIHMTQALNEAFSMRCSIFEYEKLTQRKTRGSEEYLELANELIALLEKKSAASAVATINA